MKDIFFKENMIEILDYLEEGLHIIDASGKIVYYNSFAQKIDGVDVDKAVGRHPTYGNPYRRADPKEGADLCKLQGGEDHNHKLIHPHKEQGKDPWGN
jgi:PAS domain-containing protein